MRNNRFISMSIVIEKGDGYHFNRGPQPVDLYS